ncbi:MAG: hypothetical protein M0P49_05840 [Bacilli bacterium]|nr:hypothetical protein [Bacilli bacterium]
MDNNTKEISIKVLVPNWGFCNAYEKGKKSPSPAGEKYPYPCGFMHEKPRNGGDRISYLCTLFHSHLYDRCYGIVERCDECIKLSK